ncbi:hypothetical protein [Fusobacterium polymorphum]|uniref:Uncharacterized protein n=1 Tax=Fusobacterium nucleatum subsp. polymorphum TaxID=76857 RepID=A0A2C6BS63_FUSNP|nr:hypothetical protein [Fusobacterium polymorphum]PHI06662.1 hypothetical protein CBG54_06240 [Fusobacterium polymorphum]
MKKSVLEIKIEKIDNDYSVFKIVKFNDSILKKDIKIINKDITFSVTDDKTEFYYNLVSDKPVLNINYKEKNETLYFIQNKHIENINKIITEVNKKYGIRWRGERRNCYYTVSGRGKVTKLLEENEYSDETYYKIGNYFQTEEEAIIARDKILNFWEKIKTEEI